jgi:hypothetical protein
MEGQCLALQVSAVALLVVLVLPRQGYPGAKDIGGDGMEAGGKVEYGGFQPLGLLAPLIVIAVQAVNPLRGLGLGESLLEINQ